MGRAGSADPILTDLSYQRGGYRRIYACFLQPDITKASMCSRASLHRVECLALTDADPVERYRLQSVFSCVVCRSFLDIFYAKVAAPHDISGFAPVHERRHAAP